MDPLRRSERRSGPSQLHFLGRRYEAVVGYAKCLAKPTGGPTRPSSCTISTARTNVRFQESRYCGVVFNVAIFGGLLFLPAGTLDWWRAWVFLGVVLVGTVATTASVFRVSKDLLEERFKPPIQKGQPLADKIVVVLLITAFVGLIVFIPLDVFRFHLMDKPGTVVSSFGSRPFYRGLVDHDSRLKGECLRGASGEASGRKTTSPFLW